MDTWEQVTKAFGICVEIAQRYFEKKTQKDAKAFRKALRDLSKLSTLMKQKTYEREEEQPPVTP